MDLEFAEFNLSKSGKSPRRKKNINKKQNVWILYLFIAVVSTTLIFNLVNLQLVQGNDNLYLSTSLKTNETIIRAQRGVIYDRNDNQLVGNIPSFRVAIDSAKVMPEQEAKLVEDLARLLEIPKEELDGTLQKELYVNGLRQSGKIITLSRSVDRDKILSIYSNISELPGIFVEIDSQRDYKYGEIFSHTVGYVGEVNENDVTDNTDLSYGDYIGKTGLELYYDDVLRGKNGKKIVEKNRDNEDVRLLNPIEPTPGDNIKISIDLNVQDNLIKNLQYGVDKYKSPGGAGMIMNVNTGEMLAIASLPDFDPNILVSGISNNDFSKLILDESLPLYNRSIASARPPGSTFKTITSLSALENGFITKDTVINTEGCYELGGGFNFCESGGRKWGDLNVTRALTLSSNIFFCKIMVEKGMTIDDLNQYAVENFGLSNTTNIDLPDEAKGKIASRALKEQIFGEIWYPGDSCNASVGQGLTEVTPIQMAAWIASIANGGYRVRPHIATQIIKYDSTEVVDINNEQSQKLNISDESLKTVREGMHEVVNDPWGSAWYLRGSQADPAAKTGSAEVVKKENGVYIPAADAWVTGFFPYEEPKYSFVIYLQHGGWGFEAAEVMRKFLDWFINEYDGLNKY